MARARVEGRLLSEQNPGLDLFLAGKHSFSICWRARRRWKLAISGATSNVITCVLGPFLTTCGTIDFLVDDYLGPFFIIVGTIGQWSFFVFFNRAANIQKKISSASDKGLGPVVKIATLHPRAAHRRCYPVSCCKALDSKFTLKIAGFHHTGMNLLTTAAISRLVVFPFSNKSVHPSAETCALSSGTQNFNVTVSNPKPRKKANVLGGTSLRFVSKINTFLVFLSVCPLRRSISTVNRFLFVWTNRHDRYRPISGYYEPNRPLISTVILRRCNWTVCQYWPCCPVGGTKPTIDFNRDQPTGWLKPTDRTNDTCRNLPFL